MLKIAKSLTKKGKARPTFTFLLGILQSSTLRTVWAGAVKKHPVWFVVQLKIVLTLIDKYVFSSPASSLHWRRCQSMRTSLPSFRRRWAFVQSWTLIYISIWSSGLWVQHPNPAEDCEEERVRHGRGRGRGKSIHIFFSTQQSILQLVVFHLFMLVHYQGDVSANLLTRHSLVSFIHPCRDFAKTILYTYLYILIGQRNHNGLWYSLSEKPSY